MNDKILKYAGLYYTHIKVFVLGLIVGGFIVYTNTLYVHESPVGGFVFKDSKVYNLCEIDGMNVVLSNVKQEGVRK